MDRGGHIQELKQRIAELEKQELGFIQSLRELEAQVAQLDKAYDMANERSLKLREALEKITRTYGSASAIAIARAALEVEV